VHFVPYFIIITLACSELSRGHGRPDESAVYNLARCPASLVAAFTAWRERRFRVTPKTREARRRLPLRRLPKVSCSSRSRQSLLPAARPSLDVSPLPWSTLAVRRRVGAYHVVTCNSTVAARTALRGGPSQRGRASRMAARNADPGALAENSRHIVIRRVATGFGDT